MVTEADLSAAPGVVSSSSTSSISLAFPFSAEPWHSHCQPFRLNPVELESKINELLCSTSCSLC